MSIIDLPLKSEGRLDAASFLMYTIFIEEEAV